MRTEGRAPAGPRRSAPSVALSAFLTLAAGVVALSATACGNTIPGIATVEWRLEARPLAGGSTYESLSVFASISDEDGIDNVSEIWILNDDSAYAWKLSNADWIKATEGADNWIGASALATPELASMPRGTYRFVVVDGAGQRVEKEFNVDGSFPDLKAPRVSYSGTRLSISSTWPETLALAFDGAGALIASPSAQTEARPLAEAFGAEIAARTAQVAAYGYDPSLKMGAFSERVKTR